MSAAVTTAGTASGANAVSKLSDELFATYSPANAHERMLVTQIVQSRQRLQRAYELEERYFSGRDMTEVLASKLAEFKAVTRFVTDSERAWRHAVDSLERAQRQRRRESQVAQVARAPRPQSATAPLKDRGNERPVAQMSVAAPNPAPVPVAVNARRE